MSLVDEYFIEMEGEWQEGFEKRYRPQLEELLKLLGNVSEVAEKEGYFHEKNRFVCEKFLRYALKHEGLKGIIKKRAQRLLSFLSSQEITSRDYNERIEALGIDHAVRVYWEPEDSIDKRRIGVVSNSISAEKGEVIIDIGCGVGTFTYRAAMKGAKAVGVDYSFESIKVAKTIAEERLGNDTWIRFVVADAANLPFKGLSADTIVSADFIEHIDDSQKERFLDESVRILKEKGSIVIFTPNKVRELIGSAIGWFKEGEGTRLHYGLTTRFAFEKKLRKRGFKYRRRFVDVVRPYLADMPILNEILALEILWVIQK